MQSDGDHQDVVPTALAMHVQESTHLTLFYKGQVQVLGTVPPEKVGQFFTLAFVVCIYEWWINSVHSNKLYAAMQKYILCVLS